MSKQMVRMEMKSVHILVVDDDEDDLYLITEALREVERTKYCITAVSSALRAMTELSKQSFDVIFSDYRLGAATGVDFINSLRAAHIATPVILLTGNTDLQVDIAALKAGASDFISKLSITAEVLDRSVRYALAHADRQRLLKSVLRSTKSGIAVLGPDGDISLSNTQFENFAKAAFADEVEATKRLVDLACASSGSDLMVGDSVFESHVTALPGGEAVLALHDVSQRVNDLRAREQAEERVRALAMQDALTRLPNRLAFNLQLDAKLASAAANGTKVALLLFDFNKFKEVNDLFGHAAGDEILLTAASRLSAMLTELEYCARLGGDEFVVVQEQSSMESALELSEKVVDCLNLRVDWEGKLIEASVTVGVAIYPGQGKDRQELLANADLAMYRGKSALDRSIYLFDADMDEYVRDRRTLARDLRKAIELGELSLVLQPQFHLNSSSLVGFESLLRWNSPVRGAVSPGVFIPVAEEDGLIIELDKWVLSHACHLLSRYSWLPRLAVNVSARAICQANFVNLVQTKLLESGVSPTRLELEVTETAFVQDMIRAIHNMRQIKAMGISIAMDDFGTGYSSLSLLSSFPFDRIKIDGSFIQMTGSNERADSIFKAVVGLGDALRVPVLAEGVETEEQLKFALASGCKEIQGFYLGRPLSESSIVGFHAGVLDKAQFTSLAKWNEYVLSTEQVPVSAQRALSA